MVHRRHAAPIDETHYALPIAGDWLNFSRFSKSITHIPCALQANMPPRAAWILRRRFLIFQKLTLTDNGAAL
jgi:hypothetical protein